MQQCFVNQICQLDQSYELDKDQAHHLSHVLRMKTGDQIRIVDLNSQVFLASLIVSKQGVEFKCITQVDDRSERKNEVTMVLALIKKEKWDLVLQKCTELGVTRIVPFESMRTVVKSKDEKKDKKMERYQTILKEAAQQCKRAKVPLITDVIDLKQIDLYKSDLNGVAYEDLNHPALKLRDFVKADHSMTIVIGPEGGFDPLEINLLKNKGFQCLTLGNRILRAETAAMYTLSAIDALIE